jgi:hypothetical protein
MIPAPSSPLFRADATGCAVPQQIAKLSPNLAAHAICNSRFSIVESKAITLSSAVRCSRCPGDTRRRAASLQRTSAACGGHRACLLRHATFAAAGNGLDPLILRDQVQEVPWQRRGSVLKPGFGRYAGNRCGCGPKIVQIVYRGRDCVPAGYPGLRIPPRLRESHDRLVKL